MINDINQDISKLDEFTIEAKVLIPVLQAVREELGLERANSLIFGALQTMCRERIKKLCEELTGSPREKFEYLKNLDNLRTRENDLEFEILKWEPEAIEYDVSRCIYADLFRELGEPELGMILVCDTDIYLVDEVTGPDVEYKRTQTIMDGARFCDIRWQINV